MLVNMRRMAGETLPLYTERYWKVYNLIPDCDQSVAAESFMNGLDPTSAMFRDLSKNSPKTMGEPMVIIVKDCVHEEAVAERNAPKASKPPKATATAKKQVVNNSQGQGGQGTTSQGPNKSNNKIGLHSIHNI